MGFFLPPWQQKIFSSTIAAIGRQLKQSVNVFQSLILNRRLPNKIGRILHCSVTTQKVIDDLNCSTILLICCCKRMCHKLEEP